MCLKRLDLYLSSRWGVLCTEHPENFSPGSFLSASASLAEWITSGWCGLKTQWSIWNPFLHSPHSFLKNLEEHKREYCFILQFCLFDILLPGSWNGADIRQGEQTDLKVHFSHYHQVKSGGPRHTPGCARALRGTGRRPARSPLGCQWAQLLWRPGGGPCRPGRNLKRKDETDVTFEVNKERF